MESAASKSPGLPVALFVYRRHEQLSRTLQCLRDGGVDALYVFSDGAEDETAEADVKRVRELVATIDWIEPVVAFRSENLGLSRSIRDGLDWLFERHAAAIVIEDDVCVAPEFPEFARRSLEHYAGDGRVAAVTGLRYPFSRNVFDGYPYDVFHSPRFSSWAWATWRDRWRGFSFDKSALRREIESADQFRPERAGADMPGMVDAAIVSETLAGSWDVVCAANMLLRGQYVVTPAWNMVENTGLAEGAHHGGRPPSWTLAWEPAQKPELEALRFAPVGEDSRILESYLAFFAPRRGSALLAAIATRRRAMSRR
jgi:hypothetical protein